MAVSLGGDTAFYVLFKVFSCKVSTFLAVL